MMKPKIAVSFQTALMLLVMWVVFAPTATASTGISLLLSKTAASVGESITASGTTGPNEWVPLKAVDESGGIPVFDSTKADANGNYSIDFKIPAGVSGTLTVTVGEGRNVANGILIVGTTPPADTTAPSWSNAGLTASSVTRNSLTLTWTSATDNVGVTGYRVYKDSALLSTVSGGSLSCDVTGLTPGTSYTFKVKAGDAGGNWSTSGPSTSVTTLSGGGGGGPTTTQAVTSVTGTATVTPGAGGFIGLGSEASIEIPANALTGTGAVEVKVRKVTASSAVPAGFKLAGSVYEFSVDGKNSYNFNKDVVITLSFDPSALAPGEKPEIFYFDEASGQWVSLGGTVSGNTVTVQVDHFTKFAVMIAGKAEAIPVGQGPAELKDITGHWAMDSINKLVALDAISGYPDGTFKPDNSITRAEFAAVLVKAFKLEGKGGGVFADTAVHWARDYIAAAAANGVVNGY
ncbi:MAG TPA: hypothetical protein DCZ10_15670, partial [Pelotomaculum sp.]|nr:hypothetical protein [Pelotomaculum sp.]